MVNTQVSVQAARASAFSLSKVERGSISPQEISDTVFTLLVAGKLTTADALPYLLVKLP